MNNTGNNLKWCRNKDGTQRQLQLITALVVRNLINHQPEAAGGVDGMGRGGETGSCLRLLLAKLQKRKHSN